MGRLSSFGQHLYTGKVSFDFVGRRMLWYAISAVLVLGSAAGLGVLGSGPLKDLALALFVGMAVGTYSSIFIATPLAAQLKERDPAIRDHTAKVLQRRAKGLETAGAPAPVAARPVATSAASGRQQPQRSSRQQRRGR